MRPENSAEGRQGRARSGGAVRIEHHGAVTGVTGSCHELWAETWLLALEPGVIEVYRAPGPEGYRQVRTLRRGERLSPQAFPELILTVDELLGA
ncbi:MAG TPA: Uma2 family endonuclease [Alphaproteobacteria bacterium]|nr:Uma2 family endonuclease [Alphaproteobacteria bacterium]